MTIKTIEQNILKLPPIKRIQVVETILKSLNKPDREIERAWAVESDKRLKTYRKGSVKGIPWETVKKRFVK